MIILSSGSLYTYGLSRVFDLAARAGYDGIEVLVDHRWDTRDPVHLSRLRDEFDLPIMALHSPFVPSVPGWPSDQLGRLEHTVALTRELDVPVVVTHLPFRISALVGHLYGPRMRRFMLPIPWARRDAYYRLVRENRLGDLVDSEVTVAIENMPARQFLGLSFQGYCFNWPKRLGHFVDLTLDTTHLATWGLDPLEIYRQLKGRVAHVHLSNYDGREHRLPFRGHLSLGPFLSELARDGYSGAVSVEADPSALRVEDADNCLIDLQRTLDFCRKHFAPAAGAA